MKIATYNIWNSDEGMPHRKNQIIEEINSLQADVLALQEVKDKTMSERILDKIDYKYHVFEAHEGYDEGLAIYSKYPIKYSKYIDSALIVIVDDGENLILFVNVHLPWRRVVVKEKCIVDVIKKIEKLSSDYRFILGDFNSSEMSSVQQYLKGNISLQATGADPYWRDLAMVAEEVLGVEREVTLDFSNNPRWKGSTITDVSSRMDCIFIHDCYPKEYPSLVDFKYFGKNIDKETGLCASDHYGVVATLDMPCER